MRYWIALILLTGCSMGWLNAQTGIVRGNLFEESTGAPVIFTTVFLDGTSYVSVTDENGFYSITAPPGDYTLVATSIGYDTTRVQVTLINNDITNEQLFIHKKRIQIRGSVITADQIEKTTEVQISEYKIRPRDIKRIPAVGGEADITQYLTTLPGIVSSGDQGGQLYIRGGAPVHNKVLLDGMTLYNAFHSIGLFSVYETEVIQNVDVYTGGFNAEYGGRISAVVDVTTRDGNKKKLSGLVGVSPFMTKAVLEGPLIKQKPNGSSSSFLLTAKHSYLQQTSNQLYTYVEDIPNVPDQTLPFNFTDVFGKLSFNSGTGSRLSLMGFNYTDQVNFSPLAVIDWAARGVGAHIVLVPTQSKAVFTTDFVFSSHRIDMTESDGKPRYSSIGGFNLNMNFKYYLANNSEFKYGVDVNGFSTKFEFFNALGLNIDQNQNTTEIGGFMVYKKTTDKLVFEPSLRLQYYASLNNASLEPRLGIKYNASDKLRFKFAGGLYSQNLISTKSDRDVLNLFTGFLSGPEEQLDRPDGTDAVHKLQKAWHAITGVEYDVTNEIEINIEPYYKRFTQMINLNRNKIFKADPDYIIETGNAYGIDFLVKYETPQWYIWATYSLGKVDRFDGNQTYPPHFDRRHNANLVVSYQWGEQSQWEASARWNLGSGFPFTRTQGFYEQLQFDNGVGTDLLTQNGDLGVIYDDKINSGRLPYYHRLDASIKRIFYFSEDVRLELVASVSNVYNRKNVFYFDRIRYERVNQLPILPSIGATFSF